MIIAKVDIIECGEIYILVQLQTVRYRASRISVADLVVWCVMGDSKRYCANWSKSITFCTLIDFHMLYPNLPGAKANSQWCRYLGRFKMVGREGCRMDVSILAYIVYRTPLIANRLRPFSYGRRPNASTVLLISENGTVLLQHYQILYFCLSPCSRPTSIRLIRSSHRVVICTFGYVN